MLVGLPFYHRGIPMWIGVTLISIGAVGHIVSKGFHTPQKAFLTVLTGYFLIQVFGVLQSPVQDEAWAKVLLKSSIILLPISTFAFSDLLDRKTVVAALNLFYLSCLVSSIAHLVAGFLAAQAAGQSFVFYEEFSIFMHPAYISLMLCCAIIVGIYLRSKDHWGTKILGTYYKATTTVILLSTIFLLSSRIQMLAILLVLILLAMARLSSRTSTLRAKTISVVLILFPLVFGAVMIKSNDRVRNSIGELSNLKFEPGDRLTSTTVRIVAWQICWEEMLSAPLLGRGTASCKTMIKESDTGRQHPQLAKGQLGAHNQYFNAGVDHGFPGIILLLLMLLIPLRIGFKNSNPVLFGITSLIVISLITESMFEREAGVMIFALLVPMAWLYKRRVGFAG